MTPNRIASPAARWPAPVGLRYHALHHLLPRLPYHNLGKAHARLSAQLAAISPYHRVEERGLFLALGKLFRRAGAPSPALGSVLNRL